MLIKSFIKSFFLIFLLSQTVVGQVTFRDIAVESGISYLKSDWSLGNGVSFVDFNNDGLDDITIATEYSREIQFYKNDGGVFSKLSLLPNFTDEVKQVLWVDFDNDGDKDLFCAVFDGVSRLFANDGNLNLTDVTFKVGLPNEAQGVYGATWGDFNRDGYLDLYVNDRLGLRNRIFTNNQGLEFVEMSLGLQVDNSGKLPFCSSFLDYNNDKWPDIFIADDKLTINSLFENSGNCSFKDVSEISGANLRLNSMCVAVGDYNNDGWQDIYVSNTSAGNALMHNNGKTNSGNITFSEVADSAGVGYYGSGWGSNFFDGDNDGDLDLYVSGHLANTDISSVYYENLGDGSFIKPNAGFIGDTTFSFSNAIGDYNNDGFADIIVQNEPPFYVQLWGNSSNANNWLKVNLTGVKSNRDAVGSKIEIFNAGRYQMRYIHCGIGFLAQNSMTEIIGLGTSQWVDSLIVNWPSGHVDKFYSVQANQILKVTEGSQNGGVIDIDTNIELNCSSFADNPPIDISPIDSVVTGIENDRLGSQLKLYPNPGGKNLIVEAGAGGTRLVIYSATGIKKYNGYIIDKVIINTHHWLPGIYLIYSRSSRGNTLVRKWIKE